ncbi:DEAD/DEAH box helicase [Mycobacterium tuberculosis]|nr:DEAD/DEAH box helicase [Mycobacterium tuberculosis]
MSADEQVRRAPSTDAITMAKQIMTVDQKVIKSIIFQPSRSQTMVFTRYIKDVLRQPLRLPKEKVEGEKLAAFYTGILPNDTRKRIIERLKSHDIHVIITTNALEVGIDIGDLSLAVLVGYPGSKASYSQQIGRVGRKGEGVAVLIYGFLFQRARRSGLWIRGRTDRTALCPYGYGAGSSRPQRYKKR